MKKWIIFLCCLMLLIGIFLVKLSGNKNNEDRNSSSNMSPSESREAKEVKTSLFVPYWSLDDVGSWGEYDSVSYFGITSTLDGINKEEIGYSGLSDFDQQSAGVDDKNLVLRMLDSKINFEILKDTKKQDKIIRETIQAAKEYGFSGVILDLELSALPFESLIEQITTFNKSFYQSVKRENLTYQITVYGDTYYRIRPFDIESLAKSSDLVMIMAYDFHKAGGSPGPNFPLKGKEKYGYDYTELVSRILTEVPAEKISVIFGLYGYDWQVDEKNISQSIAKPLSYLEIENIIIDNCEELKCNIVSDNLSKENLITYTASDGKKHIVWFENMESVSAKQDYLKSKGIYNFSLWAHSYF